MRLWLYSEGDASRGMGHLSRCLAYATAWRGQGGTVRWVVDGDAAAQALLAAQDVVWQAWQAAPPLPGASDVAIVDSYSAEPAALQRIAACAARVMYLDDTERLDYPAGLVIHAAPGLGGDRGEARWARGPMWQPLRPAFAEVPQRRVLPAVTRVLVLMGGTDPRGLTPRMVALARKAYPLAQIHAVLGGPAAPAPDNCTVHRQLDDAAMCAQMLAADLAISAAGQTVSELARCGTPAVLVAVAENQHKQLREWPVLGTAIAAGWWHDPQLDRQLLAALAALATPQARAAMARAGQAAVDGQGVARALAWLTGATP
ncbi:hypothetical protein N8I74_00620 [Chitiniphilus purpureus]|uniref:UDP-2,4-diacetamido-2,4, 6-trideoxy-beta-L-altropyranose hydrolase n=1 Tax=Chitiniphilus purpureus TaxID=2981137 RepID=A0ABY6DUK4_9NEIS|nr:hypothetical protein [Chitiniphilus sp. CD1]UXY15553.1 hypothetical protein N8I74_00620 [Chitiniphilus sp. CD1]